ncbi:hypothetical protein C7A11_25380 [Pseudomonas simiae]|nr:hypothetical protein C7A11_25380 [Pseudomonas simiae]TKK01958.1 hypothetical protein PflCFBP13514_19810 [Pseudomonas fluorescens]
MSRSGFARTPSSRTTPCQSTKTDPNSQNATNPLWERACSRKRRGSHRISRLIRRIREQARSHILIDVCLEHPRHPPLQNQHAFHASIRIMRTFQGCKNCGIHL